MFDCSNSPSKSPYIGRYAPSPTGPLHFGSLVAAVASYLEAQVNQGIWLLRMDDLDQPRVIHNAADDILRTLDEFGFEWHGDVVYQSQRTDAYLSAFETLSKKNLIYPCICTRKEIADSATQGIDGFVYPDTCRHGAIQNQKNPAWRIKTEDDFIAFDDFIQGHVSHNLHKDIGDFVIQRADGYFTYQLVTVVDDNYQEITHIVRGADLLDSTTRQIFLLTQLDCNLVSYAHIPVATNSHGEKLSKQTLAASLNLQQKSRLLWQALEFLGQCPPESLLKEALNDIWKWAKSNWSLALIPKQRTMSSLKFTP